MTILYAALILGIMGIIFGLVLGFAGVVFKVEQDPKIPLIRDCLPGANCGACGFAGCDAYADAVVTSGAKTNACPVGGESVADKVSEIMGVKAEKTEKKVAFVKCNGDCEKAANKFEYYGIEDCSIESNLAGGGKDCQFGCLGGGTCVKACSFDAIRIIDGIAVVDEEKCTSCGQCVSACPKNLIEIVPYKNRVRVVCNSNDKGKDVKSKCEVGCIGCMLCKKNCEYEAVNVEKFLAKVDYEKCTQCGACVEKCPTKAISS